MVAQLHPLSQRLHEVQQEVARHRVEAFVDYSPEVCGIALRPITLDSWNALMAFQNGFVTAGGVSFIDVVNFVWLHHPNFGQFNRREKKRVTYAVWRALTPRLAALNGAIHFLVQFRHFRWLGRFRRQTGVDRFQEAVEEIRRLLVEATRDIPRGDEDGNPLPFSFQAFVLNLFRRELGMPFAETRAIPLKQLAEHLRDILHHRSAGKAILLTPEETAVWADYLAEKTAEAQRRGKN